MIKFPKVDPWHSVIGSTYHNHTDCNTGNNIELENRRVGTGGYFLCAECKALYVKHKNVMFQIKAFSKSNAKLTRIKIPVSQYIIGQSFDTWIEIKNLTEDISPRLNFTIQVQMGDYGYPYKRQLESIPAGASHKISPIRWKILNQGVCTFSFTDFMIDGDSLTIDRAKSIFVDTDEMFVEPGNIFHSIVTTTPEGVYEYWAMIISAVGLTIIALEKLWPIFDVITSIFTC